VEISYEHANPNHGNESFLIRIGEAHTANTPCLLVDAGDGVDLDSLLDDDEYLAAILLTHAHLDHYQAIDDAHRDGAPILTSPGTAAILKDTFEEGSRQYGLTNTDALLERVESIQGWHDVLGDTVQVHPVPAGHTPGACGFLIRIADDDTHVRLLATGDFTERDAAGFPGFDANAYPEADILFLTAATNNEMADSLTEIIATVTERTNAGSKTLCTASGLTGVHLAALFAVVNDELEIRIPVVLAGHVAKLYDALEYHDENVTTVPEFASTTECFEHGAVTIAGPEVPVEGSSKRLFEAIADDPSATLVQVQGGNTDAKTGSDFSGTVSAHRFSNHPPDTVLDDVVESVSPIHTVIEHQRGRSLDKYKDKWDSFSWATGSHGSETLYRNGEYLAPPWVNNHIKQRVRNRDSQLDTTRAGDALLEAVESIPALDRREEIDLPREGVDLDRLRDRLHLQSTPDATESETATTDTNTQAGTVADGGLYQTTGTDLPEAPDLERAEIEANDADATSPLINTVQPSTNVGTETSESKSTSETEAASAGEDTSPSEEAPKQTPPSESDEPVESTSENPMKTQSTPDQADTAHPTEEQDRLSDTITIEIDAAVRLLAQRQAKADDTSLAAYARQAIDAYLTAMLRSEEPWEGAPSDDQPFVLEIDPALEELLSIAASEHNADSVDAFALSQLRDAVGLDSETQSIEVLDRGSVSEYLDATVENDSAPHESRSGVVQTALERAILN
jgi:putative mRNA 3-end processing factor